MLYLIRFLARWALLSGAAVGCIAAWSLIFALPLLVPTGAYLLAVGLSGLAVLDTRALEYVRRSTPLLVAVLLLSAPTHASPTGYEWESENRPSAELETMLDALAVADLLDDRFEYARPDPTTGDVALGFVHSDCDGATVNQLIVAASQVVDDNGREVRAVATYQIEGRPDLRAFVVFVSANEVTPFLLYRDAGYPACFGIASIPGGPKPVKELKDCCYDAQNPTAGEFSLCDGWVHRAKCDACGGKQVYGLCVPTTK